MVVKHGEGEKKRRGAAEKKVISLFDQKNTSPFMYWQRWKAHGDGGSLARCMKRSKCWRLYHLFFWKHRRSLWHGKPFEDTNKKHIQDILWLLCSSGGVLLRGIESLKVFFFCSQTQENDISSTYTSCQMVSRAQQVVQEVIGPIWKKRTLMPHWLLKINITFFFIT